MNKITKSLISLSLLICLTTPISANINNTETNAKNFRSFNAKATLIDKETGEISEIDSEIEPIKIQKLSRSSDEESYEATYKVYVDNKNGEITLMNAQQYEDFSKDDFSGVIATARVGYTLRNYDTELKIDYILGGWEPYNSYYLVSNRKVLLFESLGGGNSLSKKPVGNSFIYATGWGYRTYLPQQSYGASFKTEATVKVNGMSGTQHILILQSTFPN